MDLRLLAVVSLLGAASAARPHHAAIDDFEQIGVNKFGTGFHTHHHSAHRKGAASEHKSEHSVFSLTDFDENHDGILQRDEFQKAQEAFRAANGDAAAQSHTPTGAGEPLVPVQPHLQKKNVRSDDDD